MSLPTRSRALPRAVVGTFAGLAALALGVAPAGAAGGLTVPLSPSPVEVYLLPVENYGPLLEEDDGGGFTPVPVQWGGAVDLRLPAALDDSGATYLLETGAETDQEPTRTLSSETVGAGHLDVAGQADGAVRISLPTDATSGPVGLLTVDGLTGTDPAVQVGDALYYLLTFTGAGASVVPLAPALTSFTSLPCTFSWSADEPEPGVEAGPDGGCAPYAVTAGTTIGLTLPPDSLLRSVGLDTLTGLTATLVPIGAEPDDGGSDGYADGYDDGWTAGQLAGPDAEHVAAHGPSYDAALAATGGDYDAGYEAGHADGWYDATHVEPDVDPGTDPGTDPDADPGADPDADGGGSAWGGFVGVFSQGHALSEVPLTDPAPDAAMARVAAVARAVDDASAAADPAAEPEPTEEETGGAYYGGDLLPVTVTAAGAELTVPADSPAGEYELLLAAGSDPTAPTAVVYLSLTVTATPGAVVPVAALPGQPAVAPVLNQGLAANTGWTEPSPAGHRAPLVAVGGAALLVAGVGAVAVLRPRRRPVAAPVD